MLKVDVDQFTLVLQAIDDFEFDEWREWVAPHLIDSFLIQSKMADLFDNIGEADVKVPEGYTTGFSFADSPFYFCIAYHEAFSRMGVIVKFSAYAWQEYRKRYKEQYNQPLHLHTLFKLIDSNEYSYRLSRIDICCDFFNEGIDVAELKRSIEEGRTEIRYGKY